MTTQARSAALPDVPTAAEAGYPSITSTVWTAFFVPVKTPKAIGDKLGDAVLKVAAMPDDQGKSSGRSASSRPASPASNSSATSRPK